MLGLILCFLATGCGPQWKKKFIRKRAKEVGPPQAILVLQSDVEATHPPEDRYREHYAYWKSWHSDLLGSLGQIRKRDQRYLVGVVSELRAMAQLLTGPPAARLQELLTELTGLERSWAAAPEPWKTSPAVRGRLEQMKREIDKEFYYSKVKRWIPPRKTPPKES